MIWLPFPTSDVLEKTNLLAKLLQLVANNFRPFALVAYKLAYYKKRVCFVKLDCSCVRKLLVLV